MTVHPRGPARIRFVSGRFLFPVLLLAGACQATPPAEEPAAPGPPAEPVVMAGTISSVAQSLAAELFARAADSLQAGRPDVAAQLARRVVDEYPTSSVSGRALRLLAEAELEGEHWEAADDAADRYAGLLPADDPRGAEMRLLQARAMASLPDPAARMDRLLRLGPATPPEILDEARAGAREAVRALSREELADLVDRTPDGRALAPVLQSWYARVLLADGMTAEAQRYARAALAAGAAGPDSVTAEGVLRPGEVELPPLPGRRTARMGTILPLNGSPALRDVAALIAEGVEVATTSLERDGLAVELISRDDEGDPGRAAAMLSELESESVLGAVGFLQDETLAAAAQARRGDLPLVSPTAHTGTAALPGVLTLAGADPLAATAMAEYAAAQGYARVAVIHSRVPESVEEADAFENTLRELGVPLAGRYAYDAGATFFQDPIRAAREVLRMQEIRALGLGEDDTLHVEELDPVALFVPIPAEDVEYVAPQLTFFGLDTLGIEILGTSGWTDPRTLEVVDSRHTAGVVATTPANSGPGSAGYRRFREAYEAHFQRTLVSPVPALGYDAALLLLEATRSGARTQSQMQEALGRIRDLEGATGVFSVVDGRVLRRQDVVRILDGGTTIPAG